MTSQGKLIGWISGCLGVLAALVLLMARCQDLRRSSAEADIAEQRRRKEIGDKPSPPSPAPNPKAPAPSPSPVVPAPKSKAAEPKSVDARTIEVNQKLESSNPRIAITFERVEFRADHAIRLHFSIWNQSGQDQGFWIGNAEDSYLTDERGRRCDRLKHSSPGGAGINLGLPNGQNLPFWVDYQEPPPGAKELTARFTPPNPNGLFGRSERFPATVKVPLR